QSSHPSGGVGGHQRVHWAINPFRASRVEVGVGREPAGKLVLTKGQEIEVPAVVDPRRSEPIYWFGYPLEWCVRFARTTECFSPLDSGLLESLIPVEPTRVIDRSFAMRQ